MYITMAVLCIFLDVNHIYFHQFNKRISRNAGDEIYEINIALQPAVQLCAKYGCGARAK